MAAVAFLPWLAAGAVGLTRADSLPALAVRSGDRSVVLHWRGTDDEKPANLNVYRAMHQDGPYVKCGPAPLRGGAYADLEVTNGVTYWYRVQARVPGDAAPRWSSVAKAQPRPFRNDAAFLDYLQSTAFDYFWYEANPANGLVKDRSTPDSFCSIAAVGFGLSAITVGIDHGWVSRGLGRQRVLTTLRTFWEGAQGPEPAGRIGNRGWFYHFLNLETAERFSRVELSSIDTALFLAGALDAAQFFSGNHPDEARIRGLAEALYRRVDWAWMANGEDSLTMGWHPESGFIASRWIGYNEASLLYILGLGAPDHPLPPEHWREWTRGYRWQTRDGQRYVSFPPLFGHQYSQCWLDLRELTDGTMSKQGLTYFENSRRATLAQRAYAEAEGKRWGHHRRLWGFTASDGPDGYRARGAPPAELDDGTVAPTAAGGSIPFAPEACIPTLRHIYAAYRPKVWTPYGFCDAFNVSQDWWDTEVLGIDQGPIAIMIENHRRQTVWKRFMRIPAVQRGLERAGFRRL